MTNNQLTDAQISNATLIRLIRWADEHKSHYVAAALRELQERRKADSEPVIVVGYDGGDALSYRRLIQSFEPGTKLYRHAQPAPVVLKDHQIRELVNQLRDIAIEYHGTQQLRERIALVVRSTMLNGGKP